MSILNANQHCENASISARFAWSWQTAIRPAADWQASAAFFGVQISAMA